MGLLFRVCSLSIASDVAKLRELRVFEDRLIGFSRFIARLGTYALSGLLLAREVYDLTMSLASITGRSQSGPDMKMLKSGSRGAV